MIGVWEAGRRGRGGEGKEARCPEAGRAGGRQRAAVGGAPSGPPAARGPLSAAAGRGKPSEIVKLFLSDLMISPKRSFINLVKIIQSQKYEFIIIMQGSKMLVLE